VAITESICRVMKFDKSNVLRKRAHALIPGGAHVYAKGDDQYPVNAPGFIERGEGCHVWDADGNEFIEYGMGLRAVSLGHGISMGKIGVTCRQPYLGALEWIEEDIAKAQKQAKAEARAV